LAFNALMLLIGQQEGHPPVKTQWWDAGMVVWGEVQICMWLS